MFHARSKTFQRASCKHNICYKVLQEVLSKFYEVPFKFEICFKRFRTSFNRSHTGPDMFQSVSRSLKLKKIFWFWTSFNVFQEVSYKFREVPFKLQEIGMKQEVHQVSNMFQCVSRGYIMCFKRLHTSFKRFHLSTKKFWIKQLSSCVFIICECCINMVQLDHHLSEHHLCQTK